MKIFARAAPLCLAGCLFAVVGLFASAGAWADGIEAQTPDGKTVMLYENGTWEYKRPSPVLEATTLSAEELVVTPSKYHGQEVVVDGNMIRLFGKFLLQSDRGQSTMGVGVKKVRQADRNALVAALDKAGFTGSVKVQIQGTVELASITYFLEARDIILLPE